MNPSKRTRSFWILFAVIAFVSITGMKCIVTGPNTTTTVEGQHIDYAYETPYDRLCYDIGWCPGWSPPQSHYWEYQKYYHFNGVQMVLDGGQWVGGPCGDLYEGCDYHRVGGAYGFD